MQLDVACASLRPDSSDSSAWASAVRRPREIRQVLSNRVGHPGGAGILRRVPYRTEGSRSRHEYRPTQKGLDLYPVLTTLAAWGARYLADPEGAAVEMAHRDCGAPVHAVLVCDEGHQLDDVRDVVPRPGPGARPA